MNTKKKLSAVIIVAMLLQLILGPFVLADETGYYRALEAKAYKLKHSYKLTNTGSNEATNIKATILVGANSSSHYQKNVSYRVTPWPKYTYVDSSGNIYAEIYIDKLRPKETISIIVEKALLNGGVSYENEIYSKAADYTKFKEAMNNRQYLETGEKIETAAAEIAAKAAAFDTRKSKVRLAKDIYDFVNLYITYDTDKRYANKGALSAIKTAKGVCDEYATLFTALSRAVGIPARVVTGYWLDKDEPLQQGVWKDVSSNAHAWAEFYIPGVGWIPVEPTLRYTYNGVRTPNREYFANMRADDIHLMQSYQQNKIKTDISILYFSTRPTKVEASFGEQSVINVKELDSGYAFTDIKGNWSQEYINGLYNQGILFAKQPGLYKPSDNITRAEFAAYLVNALRLEPKAGSITFKDIKSDSDYVEFIKNAAAYKLIAGTPLGYFKPNDPITRQDAAVIMKNALDLLKAGTGELAEPEFNDSGQISPYAKEAVKLIYNMKIMTGKPGSLFDPKSFTTRAEAAKILDNFINVTK